MLKREVQIVNRLGLHARASAKLTQTAARFAADVWLVNGVRRVNGKSIMGVMMLAAAKGTTLKLEVDGPDEEEAMAALTTLIADKFGEAE
ncbi:MAG: HPr family phosphocarrier protein [Thiobacillaceae bacterium]